MTPYFLYEFKMYLSFLDEVKKMHRKILILDKVMSVLSWCNSFVFMELMTSHVPNFKGTAKLKTEIAGEILKILVYCFFENLIISEVLSCVKSFVSALRWPLSTVLRNVLDIVSAQHIVQYLGTKCSTVCSTVLSTVHRYNT